MNKLELERGLARLGQLLRLQLVKNRYPDEQILPEKIAEIRSIARQINAPHKP